jgi:chaperonin cofactor prefoldin
MTSTATIPNEGDRAEAIRVTIRRLNKQIRETESEITDLQGELDTLVMERVELVEMLEQLSEG